MHRHTTRQRRGRNAENERISQAFTEYRNWRLSPDTNSVIRKVSMARPKRNRIDLMILFQEVDLALDKADFPRSEELLNELIEVVEEINIKEIKSQNSIPGNRQ